MSEITFRKIVDEINKIHTPPHNQILISSGTITGNGAAVASSIILGIIPYRSWRVVNMGFVIGLDGTSTIAESVSFGIDECDVNKTDDVDYFGTFTQDVTADKEVNVGDMFQKFNDTYLSVPIPPASGGTHIWSAGNPDGFLIWQNKQGVIKITKNNVALSTALVRGWVLIEIGEV